MADDGNPVDETAETLAKASDRGCSGAGAEVGPEVVSAGPSTVRDRERVDPAAADTVDGPAMRRVCGPSSVGEDLARGKIASALFGAAAPKIGRYTVLESLGRGGMGSVYAAYDDKLDRRIAIKLLHHTDEAAAVRLLAEARALARVEHPNVVAVHDVGEDGDRVYIAMEFVRGGDLRQWLSEPRPWREVLDVFVQAGRGLGAAHEAGVLHRDFKPENALISTDGRVRVGDFGLALTRGPEHDTLPGDDDADAYRGAIVGTPPYMSLEQLRGRSLDARTDQYALCVALFEGLYGTRPYRGGDLAELHRAVAAEEIVAEPAGDVPRWLRPIVVRGLAADPNRRWPTIAALLEALQAPLDRGRGRVGWAVGALAVVGAGVAVAATRSGAPACDGAAQIVERDLSVERRQAVAQAFAAAAPTWGPDAWRRSEATLLAYADAWQARHQYFCEATHVRHELSAERLDSRVRCLERRWRRVETLMELFGRADAALVERSATALESLRSPQTCPDDEGIAPIPAEMVDEVQAIDEQIEASEVVHAAGRYADALALAEQAHERALNVDYAPARARTSLRLGVALGGVEQNGKATPALREAYLVAHELGLTALMAKAAHALTFQIGSRDVDLQSALVWSDLEAASLRRLGDQADASAWADHRRTRATIHTQAGKLDEAIVLMGEALDADTGVNSLGTATVLNNFAATLMRAGRNEEALLAARRAVEIRERIQGPDHPMTLGTTNVLFSVLTAGGHSEQALEVAAGLIERARTVLGPEHSTYVMAVGNRANALANLNRLDEALVDYTAAEQGLPDDSLRLGPIYVSRGGAERKLGRYDDAEASLTKALAVFDKHLPPGHYSVAVTLSNLANVYSDRGDHEQAAEHSARALAMLKDGAAGSAQRARTEGNLAMSLAELGRHDEALAVLDAALKRISAGEAPDPVQLGKLRRHRGGVLVRIGNDAEAVVALRTALTELEEGRASPHLLAEASFSMAKARAAVGAPADELESWIRRVEGYYAQAPGHDSDVAKVRAWYESRD